jgi:hypothetical protein
MRMSQMHDHAGATFPVFAPARATATGSDGLRPAGADTSMQQATLPDGMPSPKRPRPEAQTVMRFSSPVPTTRGYVHSQSDSPHGFVFEKRPAHNPRKHIEPIRLPSEPSFEGTDDCCVIPILAILLRVPQFRAALSADVLALPGQPLLLALQPLVDAFATGVAGPVNASALAEVRSWTLCLPQCSMPTSLHTPQLALHVCIELRFRLFEAGRRQTACNLLPHRKQRSFPLSSRRYVLPRYL